MAGDVHRGSDTGIAGWTPFQHLSNGTNNDSTVIKGSNGTLGWVHAINTNANPRFLKFYNEAGAPTVGTDAPVLTFEIPGNNPGGAGFTLPMGFGTIFTNGIGMGITTGAPANDTGAVSVNEVIVNIGFA